MPIPFRVFARLASAPAAFLVMAAAAPVTFFIAPFSPELLAQAGPTAKAARPASAAYTARGADSVHALLQSFRAGRALLDAAVAAHGGLEALRAARTMGARLRGWDHWRNQSRRPLAPFDSTPHEADVRIDLPHERIRFSQTFEYPGEIGRGFLLVTDGARSFRADTRAHTYTRMQWPPAAQQTGNLFYLPQHILLAALDNPAVVRHVGRMRLSSGADVDVITASVANGQLNLAFDRTSHRLRATVGVWSDATAGDVVQETEYPDYRELNGVLVPTRRVSWVDGVRTRDLEYVEARGNATLADADVAVPAGFSDITVPVPTPASTLASASTPAPWNEPVRTLADGVWLVQANGPSVLAVAMRDYVLLVDAPPTLDSAVLARITTLAGKPVRYAAPTHHHDDHAGGVRRLAAAGVTIVTTPGNRDFMSRIAASRPTFGPPWVLANGAPVQATIETIAGGRRTITDGRRTVELLDIGRGPHAEEMLVAWLPVEGILFQGDLLDVNADGAITRATNNATTMHFARWLEGRGIRPRVFAGSHGTLRDAADFQRLIGMPIPK